MAAAGKRHGYNTQVTYDDDGAGTNAVTISENCKTKVPKAQRSKSKATNLEATDGYQEYLPASGWKDSEDGQFDVWITDTQMATLIALMEAGTEKYWYFKLPLATGQSTRPQWKGRMYIRDYDPQEIDTEKDEPIRCTFFTQRTVGKMTFTAGS